MTELLSLDNVGVIPRRRPSQQMARDIKQAIDKIPPHYGLIWFLSRESLREIVRGKEASILTIDFHFPEVKHENALELFYELSGVVDYELPSDYQVVKDRETYSFQIIHQDHIVADIRFLTLIGRRKLQYPDKGSWISILPQWCMSLDTDYWLDVKWPVPNTIGEFIKSIYRQS